jgi:carbohydrate kinase (thermoresistant glucokinase family)
MRPDRRPQCMWSPALSTTKVIAVLMGVSGSGKTTVSVLLSAALGCQFQEGDDLHPAANVEKMHSGTLLTDADRLPWLRKIGEEIDRWRARGESGVLTCSALKRAYRDIIIGDRSDVTLVYLKGSHDLIHRRVAARHDTSCQRLYSTASLRRCRSRRQTSILSSSTSAAGQPRSSRRSCVSWEERQDRACGHKSTSGAVAASDALKGERQ